MNPLDCKVAVFCTVAALVSALGFRYLHTHPAHP